MARVFTFIEMFISHVVSSCCLVSFHFTLQGPLEHFQQGRSNGCELPRLCLSGNVSVSPSLLKNTYQYRILG